MSKTVYQELSRAGIDLGQKVEGAHKSAVSAPVRREARYPELIKLFYTISSMNPDGAPLALQFLAPTAGEGTSTLVWNFARVVASESGKSVLVIDCEPRSEMVVPIGLAEEFRQKGQCQVAVQSVPEVRGLSWCRLSEGSNPMLALDPSELRRLLDQLRERFAFCVIDCPAVADAPDALALARHCDGTILVVDVERARRPIVAMARDEIERFGGKLLGAVFNRRKLHIPAWLYRWRP